MVLRDRYLSMRPGLDGDKMRYYGVSLHELRLRCKKTKGVKGQASRYIGPDTAREELSVLCRCSICL